MADTRLTIKVEAGTPLASAAESLLLNYTDWLAGVGYLTPKTDARQVVTDFMEVSGAEDPTDSD
jgi:hypothetical protein